MGPKKHDLLQEAIDPTMGAMVDYGFFGILAKPILQLLKWLYSILLGNWGVAIILQPLLYGLILLAHSHFQCKVNGENAKNPADVKRGQRTL